MLLKKKLLILILFFFTINCSEKTYFSGNIINKDADFNRYENINDLVSALGKPNYIDTIENKYYYYNQVSITNNLFKDEIKNRRILVFSFKDEIILSANEYNLNDENQIKINEEETENELLKTGIIKKIFGGVDPSNMTNASN